jgi:hypothetical protein
MMRQVIVEAIEKRLRDVFPSVFAWRTTDFAAEELPAIVYRDTHDEVTVTVGCHLHKLTLECNLYCLGEARDMRQMLAVLVRTIGADVTWGALAEDTQIGIHTSNSGSSILPIRGSTNHGNTQGVEPPAGPGPV